MISDVRILHQKIASPARRFLRILCKFCTTFQPVYSMVQLSVTRVLSRVLWLVGPFKLRVTIQLTLSLRSYLPTAGSSNDVM